MSGLTRRMLHGCAALLALAISAFGSPRISPERVCVPERVMVRISEALVAQVFRDAAKPAVAVVVPVLPRELALPGAVDSQPGLQMAPCGAAGARAPCAI